MSIVELHFGKKVILRRAFFTENICPVYNGLERKKDIALPSHNKIVEANRALKLRFEPSTVHTFCCITVITERNEEMTTPFFFLRKDKVWVSMNEGLEISNSDKNTASKREEADYSIYIILGIIAFIIIIFIFVIVKMYFGI